MEGQAGALSVEEIAAIVGRASRPFRGSHLIDDIRAELTCELLRIVRSCAARDKNVAVGLFFRASKAIGMGLIRRLTTPPIERSVVPVSLCPGSIVEQTDFAEFIKRMTARLIEAAGLTARELDALNGRYGLDGRPARSTPAAASETGSTPKSIESAVARAKRKIRRASHA